MEPIYLKKEIISNKESKMSKKQYYIALVRRAEEQELTRERDRGKYTKLLAAVDEAFKLDLKAFLAASESDFVWDFLSIIQNCRIEEGKFLFRMSFAPSFLKKN